MDHESTLNVESLPLPVMDTRLPSPDVSVLGYKKLSATPNQTSPPLINVTGSLSSRARLHRAVFILLRAVLGCAKNGRKLKFAEVLLSAGSVAKL